MCGPPDGQKGRSPDLGQEVRASGIDALSGRLNRYGAAKARALTVAQCIAEDVPHLAQRIEACGSFLLFRHYYTVDELRLHAATFCKAHLLCPFCAIRRGAKAVKAYLARFEAVRASWAELRPFLVTLTVKDGPDLAERFKHLQASQHELWKRKHRGRGSVLDGVAGAVWSYEVKRGTGSGEWHPHLHMVALCNVPPDQAELSAEWREITGDSFIVDVRPIDQADPASGFLEVFKYAVKFADMPPADTVHAWRTLRGKRFVASAGVLRGIDLAALEYLDDPLDELPFVELLFRFVQHAGGYTREQLRPFTGQQIGPRRPGHSSRPGAGGMLPPLAVPPRSAHAET